jgi:NADH-quinone oxidoreductase subunit C
MSNSKDLSKVMDKDKHELSNVFEKENSIVSTIKSKFGDKVEVNYIKKSRIKITVESEIIIDVAYYLRNELGFDHAASVAGTDFIKANQIEVVYHLSSYTKEEYSDIVFALSTRIGRDDARSPSLIKVFKSVEYHERETFEMLGVYFDGHPRNERFLLPEDWADLPPLRRDFRIKGR